MSSAVAAPALAAAASSLRLQDAAPPAKLVPGGLSSVRFFQQKCVGLVGHVRFVCRSGSDAGSLAAAAAAADKVLEVKGSDEEDDDTSVPTPIVNIDQHSDPFATVLEMRFGDRLGALLDTMKALTDLGLNVNRGYVSTSAPLGNNKFYITRADNGAKIEDPELLESIRLTIINNLLQYHPETSERLAMGEAFGKTAPPKKLDVDIATHINITMLSPERSLLKIETADRPGLLMEILRVLGDISVVVESADINTEGLVAKDQLYVSYHGEALSKSMEEVTKNCLQYYLRRPTTEEDSY